MFGRGYGCIGNWSGSGSASGVSNGMIFGFGWFNLIIWIAIISFVVLTIIHFVKNNKNISNSESPLELLKMKYIRGEMTEEEYQKRKTIINKK